jgi:hypothetical protein
MSSPPHFTGPEVLALLDSPVTITYPIGGGVQIEKAGIIGIGPTASEAAADWGRKFALGVVLPKDRTS